MNTLLLTLMAAVLLAWDPSPDEQAPTYSYRIYHAPAPELASWTRSEAIYGLQYQVTDLKAGQLYRFYATAENMLGIESVPSDWLEWAPPVKIPFLTYDHQGVYVHGDPDHDYTVEFSTDLKTWTPVAVLKGDGSGPVPFLGTITGFYRARG